MQVAEVLFDGLDPTEARAWARRVHQELTRLEGKVPFTVVHEWHFGTIGPLLTEVSARRGGSAASHQAVRSLHARALAGEQIAESDWSAALEPALREVYRYAYAYARAYASASSAARSYALAQGYGEAEATEYGESYAGLSTDANLRAHADANALANAAAAAAAFAAADTDAYAATCPFAQVRACVRAYADQDEGLERDVCARLAEGLLDCLARAVASTAAT